MGETEKPRIFEDQLYLNCIYLAGQSKGDHRNEERYGSLLIKDNTILGTGFIKAIVHPHFKLERIIRQGLVNHAEIEALNSALMNEFDVKGSKLYVAGFFANSGTLFFQDIYTCNRCPPLLAKYGVDSINIPNPSGWKKKTVAEAYEEGQLFFKSGYKRKYICIGDFALDKIKNKLVPPITF